ncbi:ABC transporter ATP-binding protein [Puia dinghuensis]|uniref:ATP-binding protein n=1 Tax=Puia dinghuensis TaxID=1792502 RepID=A0A8J2UEJ4_9BACT|nr:ATP-binding cassette domain-containing protein [Puia dinghuensis]GGB06838.1 ATP-binding protein [Puia dinghuensis]
MKITLIDAGKRFNRDWIFRHLHYEFTGSHTYAIVGPNGSGKSTLLQSIAGAIGISEGSVQYEGSGAILPEQAYRHLSLCAPYLEVIEEMTVTEFLAFHGSFKPFLPGLSIPDIIRKMGLEAAAQKQIRYYSSGMKQRVRLAQALFSNTPVILLDEPCTNLDVDGIALYRRLIAEYATGRMIIVSSNDVQEYDFCEQSINILNWK